ncbi:Hypothetical predicted protein, partial [Mytilus galloprovincialis]
IRNRVWPLLTFRFPVLEYENNTWKFVHKFKKGPDILCLFLYLYLTEFCI